MTLGSLIRHLKKLAPEIVFARGFSGAHSYRGHYKDLAFSPKANTTAGDMLAEAKAALGETFEGYKGGDYVMDEFVDVYIAPYGDTGDPITESWLDQVVLSYVLLSRP